MTISSAAVPLLRIAAVDLWHFGVAAFTEIRTHTSAAGIRRQLARPRGVP